jgi:hypothetical protein
MRCSNGVPSNKGLKLTKPERIGALQLNPGVELNRFAVEF